MSSTTYTRVSCALLSLAIYLCGCASEPVSPEKCGPQPTEQQVNAAIHAYIEAEPWKDPDSVQVRKVQLLQCASRYNGLLNGGGYTFGWEISFEVNAKNSYGGYIGFEPKSVIRSADGKVHWSVAE